MRLHVGGFLFLLIQACDAPGESTSFEREDATIGVDATPETSDGEVSPPITCVETGGCDGSPVGSWQREYCEDIYSIGHVEVTDGGESKSCELHIIQHEMRRTGRLVLEASGRYAEESRLSGSYLADVDPGCHESFDISCDEVRSLTSTSLGVENCYEEGGKCRCEGFISLERQEEGEWISGAGILTLESDIVTAELLMCAGTTGLHLQPGAGGVIYQYRRLSGP